MKLLQRGSCSVRYGVAAPPAHSFNSHAVVTLSFPSAESAIQGSSPRSFSLKCSSHLKRDGGNGVDLRRLATKQWPLRCKLDSQSNVDVTQNDGRRGEEGAGVAARKIRNKEREGGGFTRAKLAFFVSGEGSNLRAVHGATLVNAIYGDIVMVVSDEPGCEYAREHDIPVLSFPKAWNAKDALFTSELQDRLRHAGIDYVVLAGYWKLLPMGLVRAYPRAILNIHPTLLPAFGGEGLYGSKVHEAVIHSGARFSGATIHFVDEKCDIGPILAQRVVPVLADDTPSALAARVLKEEHILYVEAVAALCEDRVFWRKDGIPLIRKSWDEAEYV